MKFFFTLLLFSFACFCTANAQKIQSPAQFLGYQAGGQFTSHYRVVEYFKYITQNSANVKLVQFGTTNEGRPLIAAYVSSEENIAQLEDIRKNNLRLSGMESGAANTNAPVIVWLSYNVHGNEPSSSEAAMQTLFDLVDPANTRTKPWLKNTVVVIDPCLNPDGRERYVNFYNPVRNLIPDANPSAREHNEPWPGGRVNHYYFDLNRDWAWQTQIETQARLALFSLWLPQIHVDFHEQGINEAYYFAPAAEPFHRDITAWQRQFQMVIGKNNAKYFDQNGWMYFTKEVYDLLYPSYGDTYPIYNGSIGMTYEQAGIGAGLAVLTVEGDTLTLAQRIAHHVSNSFSTVETASANAGKLLTEFKKFYDDHINNPPGEYKGYVIKNDNADKMTALCAMLTRNGIRYGFGGPKTAVGYNYFTGNTESFDIEPNDMVIDAHQPKAVLLNVLFEPKTFIADSNTYDITAWALPYAYGLKTYGLRQSVKAQTAMIPEAPYNLMSTSHPYAYVCPWKSVDDVRFLSALLKQHIKVRFSELPFETEGGKFDRGSLLITRAGNVVGDFDKIVTQTAAVFKRALFSMTTGMVDKGADIGSGSIKYINPPKVLLVSGEGINSERMGEVWHFFEQQIAYPLTIVRIQDLDRINWSDFNVAILADGNYNQLPVEKIQSWINDGGKLIAMENALNALADKKGFLLKAKTDKKPAATGDVKLYGGRWRESLKASIPGAIYKLNLDNTHPLGFGFPNYYYSLKLNDQIFENFGDEGWSVGTIKKDAYVAGFVGAKTKQKLNDGLLLGVQPSGKGSIVYMADDPLFRSFWENGKLLFCNAVFLVGE